MPATETQLGALQLSVSGGDIAPLVGHNAFLRWDALQKCAFVDAADGMRKFWSESHVSEDFDCALRFQVRPLLDVPAFNILAAHRYEHHKYPEVSRIWCASGHAPILGLNLFSSVISK